MDAGKRKSSRLTSAVRSTVLLFLILFPLSFLHTIVHEGGHAIVNLIYRVPNTTIYVHPFSFSGYSRPIVDLGTTGNAWSDAAGPIAGVLLPLVIFIPLWKRRSIANLFLVMLFPWSVLAEGLNGSVIVIHNGDFFNLVKDTTLPASLFMGISIILLIIGIFLTVSVFPLLGLKPEARNALWVIPVGMLLWSLTGLGITHWIVPGSAIDVQYHLAAEIIQSANLWLPSMVVVGIVLALIHVTLHRRVYRKLPASLRTETKELAWRDLRWPAVWCVVSIVIGLILIQ
ncbi:MAG TPA: hypothetical protein VEG43_01440 [Dehalococcoidia bacterium]|nr:hypothetical protein [Dehalococcoidia bacterium]